MGPHSGQGMFARLGSQLVGQSGRDWPTPWAHTLVKHELPHAVLFPQFVALFFNVGVCRPAVGQFGRDWPTGTLGHVAEGLVGWMVGCLMGLRLGRVGCFGAGGAGGSRGTGKCMW